MSNYFYHLTRENWGFPWHLFLSVILSIFIFALLLNWLDQSLPWTMVLSMLCVMAVGYVNEVIQKKSDPNYKKADFWQDMVANFVGALFGLMLGFMIIKAVA